MDTLYASQPISDVVTVATRDDTGVALTTRYDEDESAYRISVPANAVSYPEDRYRVDEYTITVENPTGEAIDLPLIFDQPSVRAVTGTVMLLADATDGSPLGIPVQISKNWHQSFETLHMGTWLRGYTMIPLAAGETRTFRLRVVYGYWGEGTFGAVSHSHLSLIGWNLKANWKWDESALGAWGESLTYDPARHAGRAHMADIRAAFTNGYKTGTDHSWTENAGGGDFLVYYDGNGDFRFNKKMKTCYRWAGPNMTEVLYSGVTDDEKIRYTYTVRGSGTLDYHRKYHKFRYEFQDAVSPDRLLFYQMAADNYTGPTFSNYYRGHGGGLMSSYTADPGGNTYKGNAMYFKDRWLSIDDVATNTGYTANSHRGILAMSSTLNGSPFDLYMHTYGRSWSTDKLLFDLSSDSVARAYSAGDVVEGEVGFLMPAKSAAVYWGGDGEFSGRLANFTQPWNAVYDEYRYNRDMNVSMHTGTMVQNYPLEITASDQAVLADFTINGGGIGHIPVIVNDVPEHMGILVQRYTDGAWVNYEVSIDGDNDYYQGYYNVSGSMDYAFSFKRPSANLSASWRMRILGIDQTPGGDPRVVAHWGMDDASGTQVVDLSGNGYDATLTGAEWDVGVERGALNFDGSEDYVVVPAAAFTGVSSQISIALWAYGGSTQPAKDSVFNAVDADNNRVLNIHIPWSSSIVYWDAGYDGGYDRISQLANQEDYMGQWNHWVFTKNASTGEMKVYLNGALWHSGSGKTNPVSGITGAWIGCSDDPSTGSYDGLLDEVILYDSALSESEVATLYNRYTLPKNYNAWVSEYPELLDASFAGDPEPDGIATGLEYVLNGTPTASDSMILPELDASGENFVFTFTRSADSVPFTTQVFQYGSTLTGWTDVRISSPAGAEVSFGPVESGLQSVTVSISKDLAVDGKLFGRLQVHQVE